tara:strand:+ start:11712 stop:12161 length:450 start_codon:yes stop_codon:yes gene_type:complete
MKNLKKLIATENRHQIILGVVFLIYIVASVPTPDFLAQMVNTSVGTAIVVILALSMLGCCNPIVAVLGLVAAYELVKRSGRAAPLAAAPSEVTKLAQMKRYNEFPKTLEEEMVQKMAPLVRHPPAHGANYKPVLDDIQDAAPVNYEGVI